MRAFALNGAVTLIDDNINTPPACPNGGTTAILTVDLSFPHINSSVIASPPVALALRTAFSCALNVSLSSVTIGSTDDWASGNSSAYSTLSPINTGAASGNASLHCNSTAVGNTLRMLLRHGAGSGGARALSAGSPTTGVNVTLFITTGQQQAAALLALLTNLTSSLGGAGTTTANNVLLADLLAFSAAVNSVTQGSGGGNAAAVAQASPPTVAYVPIGGAPSPGPQNDSSTSAPSGLDAHTTNAIIGGVIGGVVGLALVVLVAIVLLRKKAPLTAKAPVVGPSAAANSAV